VPDLICLCTASQRLREAAAEKAEAEKILQVKAAEAEAESKYLHGVGVAKQRKAIVEGLQTSALDFSANVPGAGAKDVMDILLISQYFDMMRHSVKHGKAGSTLFLAHGPESIHQFRDQLKTNFHSTMDDIAKTKLI
jgi:hypothetical protein